VLDALHPYLLIRRPCSQKTDCVLFYLTSVGMGGSPGPQGFGGSPGGALGGPHQQQQWQPPPPPTLQQQQQQLNGRHPAGMVGSPFFKPHTFPCMLCSTASPPAALTCWSSCICLHSVCASEQPYHPPHPCRRCFARPAVSLTHAPASLSPCVLTLWSEGLGIKQKVVTKTYQMFCRFLTCAGEPRVHDSVRVYCLIQE